MQNRKEVSVRKSPVDDLTRRLHEWKNSNSVIAELIPRAECIARQMVGKEAWCSLSGEELALDGLIKLFDSKSEIHFQSRKHYFAVLARAMRQVLIERARRRKTSKRGGDYVQVNLSAAERLGFQDEHELLIFNLALARLTRKDPRLGEIVRLRVYEGYTVSEIAVISGRSLSTVRPWSNDAFSWLRNQLQAA